MNKNQKAVWTVPTIRRLGTIADVATAGNKKSSIVQVGNNGSNFS